MEVQDVELVGETVDLFHQQHMRRQRVADGLVEAQGLRPDRNQLRPGDGIAAGEQGHVVPHGHEFFGQERDNPLRAAIEFRRYRFMKRCDLSNTHWFTWPFFSGWAISCTKSRLMRQHCGTNDFLPPQSPCLCGVVRLKKQR